MSVEDSDRIVVEYIGRFADGTVFSTSRQEVAIKHGLTTEGCDPLVFTVGSEEVIEGLDQAVRGLSTGEETTVEIPPEAAYGPVRNDRIREYDCETFEGMVGEPPSVGLHVEAENGLHGDVVAVRNNTVEVDFNHELAGKTLYFELQITDCQSTTESIYSN
jgi:peptidyl-prolyl cis-trans isomerase B (cyclophilin B)